MMSDLSAALAKEVVPYAPPSQWHAALVSSQHDDANGFSFGLEATFSHYHTQPRGEIMVAGFGAPYTRQDDKKAAHARAWRFRTRSDLISMLTQGVAWEHCAYFLVFWHDDAYFPPARVVVPPEAAAGAGAPANVTDPNAAQTRLNAAFADAPISFTKYMDWVKERNTIIYATTLFVPGIVDSVRHHIGEVLPKEEEATPAGEEDGAAEEATEA